MVANTNLIKKQSTGTSLLVSPYVNYPGLQNFHRKMSVKFEDDTTRSPSGHAVSHLES